MLDNTIISFFKNTFQLKIYFLFLLYRIQI